MVSDCCILLLPQIKDSVRLCGSTLSKFYYYHAFEISGVSSSFLGTRGLARKDGLGEEN